MTKRGASTVPSLAKALTAVFNAERTPERDALLRSVSESLARTQTRPLTRTPSPEDYQPEGQRSDVSDAPKPTTLNVTVHVQT